MSKAEQVDPKCIQRTKQTLGKLIAKPPMTDNLLNRPPFRYIHDIITEVVRSTGFLEGLFSADEMNAANIKDKDQKMYFLQKAIDAVAFTTGEIPKAKTSRIVAGQECERTNEFLQALAGAVLNKLDPTEAVQKVLSGAKPADELKRDAKRKPKPDKSSKPPPAGDEKRGKEKSKKPTEPKQPSAKEPQDNGQATANEKTIGSVKTESAEMFQSRPDLNSLDKPKERSGKEKKHRERKDRERRGNEQKPSADHDSTSVEGEDRRGAKRGERRQEDDSEVLDGKEGSEGAVTYTNRPPSAKGWRRRQPSDEVAPPPQTTTTSTVPNGPAGEEPKQQEEAAPVEPQGPRSSSLAGQREKQPVAKPQDEPVDESPAVPIVPEEPPTTPPLPPMAIATQMKRPGSARPAPPKIVRQATQEMGGGPSTAVGSLNAPPRLILDTGERGEEDEEDERFIVEESTQAAADQLTLAQETGLSNGVDRSTVGALARTMMETKERLEGVTGAAKDKAQEGPRISEAERRKQREMVAREIEKLQSGIQSLCRSTTPLGKIVDYVQEDIESMQKELDTWRKENSNHTETLRREESVTEQELQPLKAQLSELESHIQEQNDLIMASKGTILLNDRRIQQLLQNMSFSMRT